jgi:ABC-type sugar transport system substrate-binding protein
MSRFRWIALFGVVLSAAMVLSACGSSSSSSSSGGSTSEGTASEGGAGGGESSATDLASFEKLVKEEEAPITEWPATAPTEPIKKVEKDVTMIDIALSPEEPASLATAEGAVEAAERLGWNAKILYGEFSAAKTNAAFEQAIALGAKVVVVQGIEPSQYKSAIKKLHEAGGLLISTYSDEGTETGADAEVSEHSKRSGEVAASKAIVDSGGEGTFAQFNFPEYLVLNNRTEGAQKKFEECSGCEVLPVVNTASAEAEKTMPTSTSTLLQKNPDLTGFLTGIDTFVTAYQLPTIRQQNSEVGVYTYLGGKPTLEALEKEEIKAVVVDPLIWGGWEAIDSALRLLDGQEPDGDGMAQRLLTPENVGEALKTAASNGFWDADGFDYRGEFEKLWGLK